MFAAIRKPLAVAFSAAVLGVGAAAPAQAVLPPPDPPAQSDQGAATVQIVKVREAPGFQWGDAGIGAGVAAAVSLLAVSAGVLRRHRSAKTLGA